MLVQCESCLGRYLPDQGDGLAYFHICPPVAILHVQRGPAALDVPLAAVLAGDVELSRRYVERANKRDETREDGRVLQPNGAPVGTTIVDGSRVDEVFDPISGTVKPRP